MDHHCPFTGNCIAARNHGHFLLMYLFAVIGLAYALVNCALVLLHGHHGGLKGLFVRTKPFGAGLIGFVVSFARSVLIAGGPIIAIMTVASVISLLAILGFGIPVWTLACNGSTIIENNFPMKEYVQIKPQVYCPLGPGFYNLKISENICQLLGSKWYLRLLCPGIGLDLDLSMAIAPRPSPAGVEALRQRIDQVAKEGVKREVKSCRELGINPGPQDNQA